MSFPYIFFLGTLLEVLYVLQGNDNGESHGQQSHIGDSCLGTWGPLGGHFSWAQYRRKWYVRDSSANSAFSRDDNWAQEPQGEGAAGGAEPWDTELTVTSHDVFPFRWMGSRSILWLLPSLSRNWWELQYNWRSCGPVRVKAMLLLSMPLNTKEESGSGDRHMYLNSIRL